MTLKYIIAIWRRILISNVNITKDEDILQYKIVYVS